MKLIIGNKSVSSWSMRPWVLMKHFGLPFEEVLVKLDLPETRTEILKHSPTGKVPALQDGELNLWESVSIMEYLNEKFPEKQMYPVQLEERAQARSLVMEMHAGFADLREHLSFNAKKRYRDFDHTAARADIERIKTIWTECLVRSQGPFLFGKFGLVDAMFAPVVGRFQTYGVPVSGAVRMYYDNTLNLPAVQAWYAGAEAENFEATLHR